MIRLWVYRVWRLVKDILLWSGVRPGNWQRWREGSRGLSPCDLRRMRRMVNDLTELSVRLDELARPKSRVLIDRGVEQPGSSSGS